MIVENVNQREIQKRGGLYAKFPNSYIICNNVVEFKWFARYLNTENKNTSLYILYERKNTK
jgi:hypothetical protein